MMCGDAKTGITTVCVDVDVGIPRCTRRLCSWNLRYAYGVKINPPGVERLASRVVSHLKLLVSCPRRKSTALQDLKEIGRLQDVLGP